MRKPICHIGPQGGICLGCVDYISDLGGSFDVVYPHLDRCVDVGDKCALAA
jgi:hypothetical protein